MPGSPRHNQLMHNDRFKPWYQQCAEINVARLRTQLEAEKLRQSGLTFAQRQVIRMLVSEKQKVRRHKDLIMEKSRKRWQTLDTRAVV